MGTSEQDREGHPDLRRTDFNRASTQMADALAAAADAYSAMVDALNGHRPSACIPTARTRKVLEYAREEAASMGHSYVGTEHLLLGLLREGEGIAIAIMINLRAAMDLEQARSETRKLMGIPEPASAPLSEVAVPTSESTGELP